MKRFLWTALGLLLAACSLPQFAGLLPDASADTRQGEPQEARVVADLPDYGPAPELTNIVWLNVEAPLRLADLRGRVVLLDMWTFG